jgi:signal transduction histidine kinase
MNNHSNSLRKKVTHLVLFLSILLLATIISTLLLLSNWEKTTRFLLKGNHSFLRLSHATNQYQQYFKENIENTLSLRLNIQSNNSLRTLQEKHRRLTLDLLSILRENIHYIDLLSTTAIPRNKLIPALKEVHNLQEQVATIMHLTDLNFNQQILNQKIRQNIGYTQAFNVLNKHIRLLNRHLWTLNEETANSIRETNKKYRLIAFFFATLSILSLAATIILFFSAIYARLKDIQVITQALRKRTDLPKIKRNHNDEIGEIIQVLVDFHHELLHSKSEIKTKNVELNENRYRIEKLNQTLIETIENERRDMSQFIHNELGQCLTAIHFELEWLKQQSKDIDPNYASKVESSLILIRKCLAQIKQTSQHIHPPLIQELGFQKAAQSLIQSFSEYPFVVNFNCEVSASIHDTQLITLYRSIQEALTNIARHAKASTVTVSCIESHGKIELDISDDGIGLPPNFSYSMGLSAIESRVNFSQGTFFISSKNKKGTQLIISIPKKSERSLS